MSAERAHKNVALYRGAMTLFGARRMGERFAIGLFLQGVIAIKSGSFDILGTPISRAHLGTPDEKERGIVKRTE